MEKYKLTPKDRKIFSQLTADFSACEKFSSCSLNDVIVTPEIKLWEIRLQTAENLDSRLLRDAEVFLSAKFAAKIIIEVTLEKILTTELPEEKILPTELPDEKNLSMELSDEKNLSTELPEEKNLSTELPEEKNLSTELPDEKNLPTELPEEKNLPTELSEEKNLPTELSDEKNLSTELPEEKNLSTELPEEKNLSTELPEEKNLSTELPDEKNLSTELPEEKNLSTELPEEKNLSTELPEEKNLPTELPEEKNLSMELSDEKNLSTELPEEKNLSTELPEEKNLPTELPDEKSLSMELSDEKNLSTELPEEKNLPTELPEEKNLPTELPEEKNLSTELPEEKVLPTELPEEKNLSTELPDEKNLSTELPEEKVLPTELPEEKNLPTELPEEKNLPTELPDEKNLSTELSEEKNFLSGEKIFGKKIRGEVTEISKLVINQKCVIRGEIGSGEKNGVSLREFKPGSSAVTFSLTDSTDGVVCKKFFYKSLKENAKKFAENLKSGMTVKIHGTFQYDDYMKENVFSIESVEKIELAENARTDDAKVKRTELHVHTTMSALDAIISPKKLVETAASWNWSSIAVTDHGVIQAFPEAAQTAESLKKQGKNIKIIYGMEGYLNAEENQKSGYHIILLVKNKIGLGNLYRLVSISQLKFFYRTPRIPKNILAEMREGLIIGSACEAGELIRAIVEGKSETEIEEIANFYDYLEIQPFHNNDFLKRSKDFPNINTDEDLININKKVAALAEKLNKPLVATCDAHFLNKEDYIYRAILMHGKGFADAEFQPPLYLRTTEEMLKEFSYLDEKVAYDAVVTNPNKIAAQVEELKPIPDGLYSPEVSGAAEEIRAMSYKKAKYLYGENLPKIVEDRLEEELKPIIHHGFSSLYLIAQKLVKKSNDDGYLVGSRGSVGSSLVATMMEITEVNPLPPHYRCPKCQYSKFFTHSGVGCGYDLEDKNCPVCGYPLIKDGHEIPFAVFLGFDGDKVPDIDLNFSGEYQPTAHKFTEVLFGRHNVYRAGTIMTVAEKTAFGYVKKYFEEKKITKHNSYIAKLAEGCMGVKSTTGQHAGGIMVVPRDMDIHYFSPIQYPAEKKSSQTITTHFDYHSINSRLVKLDILGHDDPTVIKMLENIIHRDPKTIPLDDKATLKIFNPKDAIGIPEFRTSFTRQMIEDTHPDCFSDLVIISGFSHGTAVWLGNAQDLIRNGQCTLKDAISARDDIMMYLIQHGVDALKSFKIMERVRKGKGISADAIEDLKSHGVPDWYIDSCQKIKYLFPRAHASAYVMMAYRIAYCKVHYPLAYYAAYFSIRADEFDANEIIKGEKYIKSQIESLESLSHDRKLELKESGTLAVLQLVEEMLSRGFGVERVDLYKSDAEKFIMLENSLLPPLASLDGVGHVAAKGICEARKGGKFTSIEDLKKRAKINKTSIAALKEHGCLDGLDETDQINLFAGF